MIHFMITIYGMLEPDRSITLWNKIKRKDINCLVAFTKTFVYGDATANELKDILYECALLGYKIDIERGREL